MPEPLLNLKADQSYQLFFELNAAPMLLTDGAHFAIRAVNKAFTTHFGFSEADLLHKPLSSIHADHDQIRLQKCFKAVIKFTRIPTAYGNLRIKTAHIRR